MTTWRYFLSFRDADLGRQHEAADEGRAAMTRLPVDAPVSLAEGLMGFEGVWEPDDAMWRAKYLGSDYEFTEISAERAQELLHRWVQIGRLERLPSEESSITPELAAHLTGMDAAAAAQWADVPTPPGAEDVGR